MEITKNLRGWLVANCGCKADAADDELRKAAAGAIVEGKLTAEKLSELTRQEEDVEADEFSKKLDGIADGLEKLVALLQPKREAEAGTKDAKPQPKEGGDASQIGKMVARMGGTAVEDGQDEPKVRLKRAMERYDATRKALHYPMQTKEGRPHVLAGRRVEDFGRPLDEPSQLDKAVAGAWAKFQIQAADGRKGPRLALEYLTEHERDLLAYAADEMEWDDSETNRLRSTKGYPGGLKALIDDSTSGGLEAAPIVFDDQVIQTPLLHGELFPLVNTKPLDRGRRVEGVATGTVTGSWGGVDDTSITLFTTTAYVTAFDTTIFRWEGSIKIGLDFLSDSPIDFGAHITEQYGQRLLEDLDDVIAYGDGTTQPEGVQNKSGVTAVAWGGSTTIGNYESLMFSVLKPEVNGPLANTAVFCGTYTSYQRAVSIPVGASDARRIFNAVSMPNYQGYQWMGRPYKINQSLGNTRIFYAVLGRYRMYRRRGLTVRTSTEGDTLIRANEMLISVTSRWGGQLERAACAALTSTAPS